MKTLTTTVTGVLMAALLAVSVPAGAQTQQRHQVQLNPAVNSKVPQAQKATVQKSEQERQQRDKKLKVRAANVQSRGGQTSLQKPAHR